jgi:hypothetical protein
MQVSMAFQNMAQPEVQQTRGAPLSLKAHAFQTIQLSAIITGARQRWQANKSTNCSVRGSAASKRVVRERAAAAIEAATAAAAAATAAAAAAATAAAIEAATEAA